MHVVDGGHNSFANDPSYYISIENQRVSVPAARELQLLI